MKLVLSPADKKLLNEVLDPTLLAEQGAPWLHNVAGAVREMAAFHEELQSRGKRVGMFGQEKGFAISKIAHWPSEIAHVILKVDPEILSNETKCLAFLDSPAGAPWDLRKRHRH